MRGGEEMGSFVSDIVNSFKPGSMNPVERNLHGIAGIVGVVASIALAIFGAPVAIWVFSGIAFSTLVVSAMIESKGLAYSAYIACFGLTIAAAATTPMQPAVWIVY